MPDTRSIMRSALFDALPHCLPVTAFAFVMGLAIVNFGGNPLVGWSSSWIIFGGAAQLTLISLLGSGASFIGAVSTALVVNARHLMYSGAMAPHFQNQPRWMQFLGPYFLIDQVFALAILRRNDDPATFRIYYLTIGFTLWSVWLVTTALGLLIGPLMPDSWQLHFAIPIMFLGIVVMGLDRFPKLMAALVGAGVAFACAELPNRSGLLVGAIAGTIIGTITEKVKS